MIIYTDGATSNNGKENAYGGWAFVVVDDNNNFIYSKSGSLNNTTNNICELTAVIEACYYALGNSSAFEKVEIISDSAYIINCYNQKWYYSWQRNGWRNSKKEPVANKELWEELIPFFEKVEFEFVKVKGHAENKWNNLADELAVKAKFEKI